MGLNMFRLKGYPSNATHYFEIFFVVLVLLSQYIKVFYIAGFLYFFVAFLILLTHKFIHLIKSSYLIFHVAIWLLLVSGFFAIKLISEEVDFWRIVVIARQYFGWLVFYFYFSLRLRLIAGVKTQLRVAVIILRYVLFVIISMCVVELFFHDLPIFSLIRDGFEFDRVYGIAARPSSTATILVASSITLVLCSKRLYGAVHLFDKRLLYAALGAFLTIQSGAGLVALLMAIVIFTFINSKKTFTKHRTRIVPLFFFMLVSVFVIFFAVNMVGFQDRLSMEYITFLIDLKLNAVDTHARIDEFLIGVSESEYYDFGSDFAIFSMIGHVGVLGFILFVLISTSNSSLLNLPGLLIMIYSLLHYGAPFVSSGSIVFGIIASVGAISLASPRVKHAVDIEIMKSPDHSQAGRMHV